MQNQYLPSCLVQHLASIKEFCLGLLRHAQSYLVLVPLLLCLTANHWMGSPDTGQLLASNRPCSQASARALRPSRVMGDNTADRLYKLEE